ncbi:aromatic ring-hydroxylating dioxygenase subunit alpha [Burkholderia multivorans]|uniref:aromatic ring-hydroxylating dioxygenase subunit alpha n=1 Tax=Burkholderia multivorans TaxID=87883 RepID=UPI001C25BE53|nr:aromatic ring-hydroxylating dioxygenase subunit alpha [Burkholderia multivorans]MBU9597079.1 aromatic ring-hydroxylating dioxygenase subunit alpha [Burkholderia multivorans]MDN7997019.1 aromatic ring-hydroxylating dioxygenase subunit alpha [Burkholderia multivorans]WVN01576.1 aromatic ring-hydroxylating dioxygenase subunit alpha [Burkholderia multivorans]
MSTFLKQVWYMAAWASEVVGDRPLARTIADTPVVLFRDADGQAIAMLDRCPHRFAPLSLGKVEQGRLRCGYHGLVFDPAGRCVENPFANVAPAAACVPAYKVIEQDSIIWVWLGDAERATPDSIPRYAFLVDPGMRNVYGYTASSANYELLTDNLMDLTHARFLHPDFGGELYAPEHTWRSEGDVITSCYLVRDIPNPPLFELTFKAHGKNVDLWDDITWRAPACLYLDSGFKLTGRPREEGSATPSAHIITPETATTSHYFWASGNKLDNPMTDEELQNGLSQAFDHEDKPMIEAVQRRMGSADFWSLKPVLLKTDAAAVIVRRVVQRRLKEEAEGVSSNTSLGKEVPKCE